VSKGAGGARCKLDAAQLAALQGELDAGPVAHVWDEDLCWTLARIAKLICGMFRALRPYAREVRRNTNEQSRAGCGPKWARHQSSDSRYYGRPRCALGSK